ncbi:MAG TPA: helix-hairpin-helix domain-containing protein [Candidatus Paceibacterota bacterium]
MKPALRALREIPGVGPRTARDLYELGYRKPTDLARKDPEKIYAAHNRRVGRIEDRCLLYVFRCAVYYADGGRSAPKLKWWNWKD